MPWFDSRKFWVGRHKTHGIIVFDREANDEGDSVTVFYFEEDRLAICKRHIMRQHSRSDGISDADARLALHAYRTYPDRQLAKRHREFLARLGRSAAEVRRRSSNSPQRATHCYACKAELDTTVDFECVACDWILCRCGACGCGYS